MAAKHFRSRSTATIFDEILMPAIAGSYGQRLPLPPLLKYRSPFGPRLYNSLNQAVAYLTEERQHHSTGEQLPSSHVSVAISDGATSRMSRLNPNDLLQQPLHWTAQHGLHLQQDGRPPMPITITSLMREYSTNGQHVSFGPSSQDQRRPTFEPFEPGYQPAMSSQYNQIQYPQAGYGQPTMLSRQIPTFSRQPVGNEEYGQEEEPAQQQHEAVSGYDQHGQVVLYGPARPQAAVVPLRAPPLAAVVPLRAPPRAPNIQQFVFFWYEGTPLPRQKAGLTKAAFYTLQFLDKSVRTMMIRYVCPRPNLASKHKVTHPSGPIHQSRATPMSKLLVVNKHGETVEADHITVSYKNAELVARRKHITAHGYVEGPRSFEVIDATSDGWPHDDDARHRREHKDRWPRIMDSTTMDIDLSNPPF
ncbi:hypothetical protein BU16DRAFT_618686 [Lophium mytilinum]|uniref:Uncharacterized protein n=1 Tax=Lophium mytilinum TaxID=390894 RepID=A0A6A6QR62_9PEZI|nr:hypothetical protein BU16DRAFT_618686 [Lophium mytilinum]